MFINASATLYHRQYDSASRMDIWIKTHLPEIYLETTNAAKLTREGWSDNCNMFACIKDTGIAISEQDILVNSIIENDISSSFTVADLHRSFEAYTVISVDVYDFGGNPHIEVRGK